MDWSFKNESQWKNKYPQCSSGQKQSPINIDTSKLNSCELLCSLGLHYNSSTCHITNVNNTPTVYFNHGSFIVFNGHLGEDDENYQFGSEGLFQLKKMTIHTPSMHTINGPNYDMEIMLYHYLPSDIISKKTDENKSAEIDDAKGVIISLFLRAGSDNGSTNEFLSQFLNRIPKEEVEGGKEIQIPVNDDWNPKMLLPKNKAFFTYAGSLPNPPCNQNWYYIVFEEAGVISRHLLEGFKIAFNRNRRMTKSLKGRSVNYNNNAKFDQQNEALIIEIYDKIKDLNSDKKKLLKELPNDIPVGILSKQDHKYLSDSKNDDKNGEKCSKEENKYSDRSNLFKKEDWYISKKKSIKYTILFIVFILVLMLSYYTATFLIISGFIPGIVSNALSSASGVSSNNKNNDNDDNDDDNNNNNNN